MYYNIKHKQKTRIMNTVTIPTTKSIFGEVYDANFIQWKRISLSLHAEDAEPIRNRKDGIAYETYVMIEKVDGNWQATDRTKDLSVKFSWLAMTPLISNEIAMTGSYNLFQDALIATDKGMMPGMGKSLPVRMTEM